MIKARFLLLMICFLLTVGCQPNVEVIASKVQLLLQEKLDIAFGNHDVRVENVVVVRETGNKYQGVANVTSYGASTNLKLAILADGTNIIYETTAVDWASFITFVNQKKVKAVEGKYSDVAVNNETVFSCFPDSMRKDKAKFVERLSTVMPVELQSAFWFGNGCKAHECGSEEAAWAIDPDNAKGYAIILSDGGAGPTFSIHGGKPEDLPPPLLSWALEKGMTRKNSVVIWPENDGSK